MGFTLNINMGFTTNSSSAIHDCDKKALEDPRVVAFIKAYNLQDGYVGDLDSRSSCDSLAITTEQKQQIGQYFINRDYGDPSVNFDENSVTIVYGDEYQSVTSELAHLLSKVCKEKNLEHNSNDYH